MDIMANYCRSIPVVAMTANGLQLHAVAEALACAVGAIECRCCYQQLIFTI